MIYAYIRVSTSHQHRENQKFEISNFARKNNIKINRWIKETISSTKDLEDRKLNNILKYLKAGDILVVTEISRLGRNLLQIMDILNNCIDCNYQIWTIKENYKLGADIQSKILSFAFGLSAEIERHLISQRTKESLLRAKYEGKILGRPKGLDYSRLKGNEDKIAALLRLGVTKVEIARVYGIHWSNVCRFIKYKMTEYDITPLKKRSLQQFKFYS